MTFVLTVLAYSVLSPQGDLGRKISFETPAAPIDRALEGLSQAAGVRFLFAPTLKDQILVVHVKDVSVKEVMDKVAEASSAEWQAEAGGYRLIRSAKLQQDQENRHWALRAEIFAKGIAKVRARLEKEGDLDENKAKLLASQVRALVDDAVDRRGGESNWDNIQRIENSLPGGRLAAGIACTLDPNVLARLTTPGRVVFATNPNRMQKPLPAAALTILNKYAQEQELLSAQLPNFGASQDLQRTSYTFYRMSQLSKIKDTRPAKVLVEVKEWEFASNAMVNVMVANASGRIFESSSCSLDLQQMPAGPPPTPGKDPSGESPIELSQATKDLSETFKSAMARGGDPENMGPLPESVKPILMEPEKHNMCELACSDLLLGTARAKGINVVAAPHDLLGFFMCVFFAGGSPSPSQFIERMRTGVFEPFNAAVSESSEWLILKEADPVETRKYQADRFKLGKLVRTAAKEGHLSIEDISSFAAAMPEEFERMAVLTYIMMAAPKVGKDFERSNWQALRLHGSLTGEQRIALERGEKLSYVSLSPFQKHIFDRVFFQDDSSLSKSSWPAVPQPGDDDASLVHETLQFQVTEHFPNGMGSEAYLSCAKTGGPTIRCKGVHEGHNISAGDFGIPEFASTLIAMQDPKSPWGQEHQLTEFTYVNMVKFEYKFVGDRQFTYEAELQETTALAKPVSSPDKLPADVWKQIQDEMAKIRQIQVNRKPPHIRSK